MNTIIWIDDRSDDMEQIARGTFCALWKSGIFNKTVFLGDYVQEVSGEDCKAYSYLINDLLYEMFQSECENEDEDNEDENNVALRKLYTNYKENYDVFDMATCINDEKNCVNKEQIVSMINHWKRLDSTTDIFEKDSKKLADDYKVDCFFQLINNPSQFVYALDIVLLKGDEEKLNCDTECSLPVLSMELYHYITKELKCKCLLYSRYTYLNRLANNWKKIYLSTYLTDNGNQENHKECDLNILPRDELYEGSVKKSVIQNLKDMFERT